MRPVISYAREVSPEGHFGPCAMLRDAAPSVGPDRWNPVQNRGYEVVPKEPSWPRDTFGQKPLTEGLARRLGTRGARILGILGCSGSPGVVWASWDLWDPGRSWDLGDPEIWGNLGWRDRGSRGLYIYNSRSTAPGGRYVSPVIRS